MTIGLKAIELAAQSIGVREETTNWGKWVSVYLKFCGIFTPAPWCAAFVNYKVHQAAKTLGVKTAWPKSAWVPSLVAYGKKHGLLVERYPQVGMAFVVWHADKKRFAHVGFIQDVQKRKDGSTWFLTIEGNSNDDGGREGYKVAANWRKWGPRYRAIVIQ